jgi:hypothetical protein
MWRDIMAVSLTSDYTNPRLAAHLTGDALGQWTQTIGNDKAKGWVARGALTWNPTVRSATPSGHPTTVEVQDCLDDTHWVAYTKDGKPVSVGNPSGRQASASIITLQADRVWRVSAQTIGKVGTC